MSVTKITENYIESHPSISDCLKMRLINYSKLSRLVIKERSLSQGDFDAVLIACRRYFRKIAKANISQTDILDVFTKSRVTAVNKIAVIILDRDIYYDDLISLEKISRKNHEPFYAIEGSSAFTIVISSNFLEHSKSLFKSSLIKSWKNLALIVVRSPEGKQDTTPGFMSFLANKISRRGINILEFMSCWSETLFVVSEKDIAAVMDALKS